ncbi:RNA polymerase sigma factor [Rathayibacter festucae]|uniref:RNA polymerase sigma factor n=1 Tax=Rathayibacter festucae TaxID=110937 RepID=UPI002A6A786E|nr:sigma factor [Rathayibacter festucae]MDY0914488.1 sigma factor [Rathayibacter festucae]
MRFEEAVELNGDTLLAYFLRRTDTRKDAADLLSETLLTVWRRARALPTEDEGAWTWMFGVARITLSHHRRGQIGRRLLSEKLAQDLAVAPAPVDSYTGLAVRPS